MKTKDPAQHGDQLTWLVEHPQALTALAGAAGAERGWWRADTAWSQRFARFNPLQEPYCVFLYESEGATQNFCTVEVWTQPPGPESDYEATVSCVPLGWLKLTRFPHDSALPTLAQVLAGSTQARVVRYRPQMRCTLRDAAASGQAAFVKVFPDQFGEAIYQAGQLLWAAAQDGELGFRVAEPLLWDADELCLRQSEAPGTPVHVRLLGAQGAVLGLGLGKALATLAKSSLPLPDQYPADWQRARSAEYMHELAARTPRAAGTLAALQAQFDRAHERLEPAALVPLHGAPHPQQWLTGVEGFSLVDFDRCGLGDAELDVATFVAEVDFSSPRDCDVVGINAAFVRGFESVAGPLDPLRLGLYRAHKHVAKALRLARGVKLDGSARAVALVEHVRANFDAMCAAATARTWVLAKEWKRRTNVLSVLILSQSEALSVGVGRYLEPWL